MIVSHLLQTPGEHALTLQGLAGAIEACLSVPETIASSKVAFIGHPHSLQGGTMNNKVVTTLAKTYKELGIPSLRFNFRGVGASEGVYDAGLGESDDMLHLVDTWRQEFGEVPFIFAGFSFGSYVAYRAASQTPGASLVTIAPPVHHYDYHAFKPAPNPWLIVMGDADEVVPAELVYEFAAGTELPVIRFPDTGHFFHGKLLDLKARLLEYYRS